MERVKDLANKIIRIVNAAEHPADALTALQLVMASTLYATGVDPQTFMHRVLVSLERIENGDIKVNEESSRG